MEEEPSWRDLVVFPSISFSLWGIKRICFSTSIFERERNSRKTLFLRGKNLEVSEIVNTSLEKKIQVALKADRNNIVAPLIQTSLHPSLFCRITTVHIIKNSLKIKFFVWDFPHLVKAREIYFFISLFICPRESSACHVVSICVQ